MVWKLWNPKGVPRSQGHPWCKLIGLTPDPIALEPRNCCFKQVHVIFLSHSKFEGYCLKGSHYVEKCGEDPGKMGWVYWTKKYIRAENICVTCESGANALWSVVQRSENLAFLCQGCCWLQFRTISSSLASYVNMFFCILCVCYLYLFQ